MNNGYTYMKPDITVEKHNIYSASFAAAVISPLSSVEISGLPAGSFNLSVSAECVCGENSVWKIAEKVFTGIDVRLFNYSVHGKISVSFSFDDFDINYSFLAENKELAQAEIKVMLSIDGNDFTARESVKIAPCTEWSGIEYHPETLASFVTPESAQIADITKNIEKIKMFASSDDVTDAVASIVSSIRRKNIVCAKRDSYGAEKKQEIKAADVLTDKSSILATPTELAVMFCACAERLNLSPVIVFLKNTIGAVNVFCGIDVYRNFDRTISESLSKARKSLENGELIVFDPAVLSSAQTIEVSHASAEASAFFHKAGTDMLLMLDIDSARRVGIMPIYGGLAKKTEIVEPREALAKMYTGLVKRPVFKLLDGDYRSFDVLPLVGDRLLNEDADGYVAVKPLELSEKISDFAGFCDNFASFTLNGVKPKNYNENEMPSVMNAYSGLKERVYAKNCAVCGIYENLFHTLASRMTFGNVSGMSNYLVNGFVRLTEAKSGNVVYMPVCFSKITLDNKFDYRFSYDNSRVIVNTVLLSYLSADDSGIAYSNSVEEIFSYFIDAVSNAADKYEGFSEITFVREFAIVKADLSEFVLWNDLRKYGKNMLANGNFAAVVSGNDALVAESKKHSDSFAFPLYSAADLAGAIKSGESVIVEGHSVSEKTDAAVNKIAVSLYDGQTVLVSSDKTGFLNEIVRGLSLLGLDECALMLSEVSSSAELIDKIRVRLAEALTFNDNQVTSMATEFDKNAGRIDEFCKLISTADSSLGITVLDAVASYSNAVKWDGKTVDTILPVNEKLFNNISEQKFNMLFELAEKLIYSAIKAQRAVAVPENTPIKDHPLYPMTPEECPTEEQVNDAFDIISRIRPVLTSYRDNFLEICDEMGMQLSDVKNLEGLYNLNELYKVIISARELEIPEDFASNDIFGFANGAGRIKNAAARIENIEYRLKFFGKELFEDVDTLLSGYNHTEGDKGSIIKKFLVRRNNKDVLLQYITAENRAEFAKHDVGEIYELLEEYREQKKIVAGGNTELLDENGTKLATLAKEVGALLSKIYPGIEKDGELLNAKAGKVIEFIRKVSCDAVLSKNLTYARARLAQVYSDNDCLLSVLSGLLGADFTVLNFDCGILDYNGFPEYLHNLEKNIPAIPEWILWLKAKKELSVLLPSFAVYLEENGIKENTDRVFAASLIKPAVNYLFAKYGIEAEKGKFDAAKIKYKATLVRARDLAKTNTLAAFRQKLKHFAQTVSLAQLEADISLPVAEFINKHKDIMFGVFPVMLVDSQDVGVCFGGECVVDTLVCDGENEKKYGMLSAVSVAKSVFMINYSGKGGFVGEALEKLNTKKCDVSYHLYGASRKLSAYLGNGKFMGGFDGIDELSVDTVNGTMRRTADGAVPAEAELCVTKAAELASRGEKRIGIFAVGHGQYAYIKHLLCLCAENDEALGTALDKGVIKVFDCAETCFEKLDNVLVSLGAAVDKSGSVGWSFGYGEQRECFDALNVIANAATGKVFFAVSLAQKDVAKIKSNSTEAEKLHSLLKFVQSGVLPLGTSAAENENGSGIRFLLREKQECSVALGRYECGADAVCIDDSTYYVADNGASESIYDKLAASMELAAAGLKCENVSVLDKITF